MSYVLSGGEHNEQINKLLLCPEDPFFVGEEVGLEGDGQGHGQAEKEVLVIDEGEEVAERNCDQHDQDQIRLVWGKDPKEGILQHQNNQ